MSVYVLAQPYLTFSERGWQKWTWGGTTVNRENIVEQLNCILNNSFMENTFSGFQNTIEIF